jgi:hypothetical protein
MVDCYFGFVCKPDGMAGAMIAAYFLVKHDIEGVIRTMSKQEVRRWKAVA